MAIQEQEQYSSTNLGDTSIIQAVLSAFPEAVSTSSPSTGELPLVTTLRENIKLRGEDCEHVRGEEAVAMLLLEACPSAAGIMVIKGEDSEESLEGTEPEDRKPSSGTSSLVLPLELIADWDGDAWSELRHTLFKAHPSTIGAVRAKVPIATIVENLQSCTDSVHEIDAGGRMALHHALEMGVADEVIIAVTTREASSLAKLCGYKIASKKAFKVQGLENDWAAAYKAKIGILTQGWHSLQAGEIVTFKNRDNFDDAKWTIVNLEGNEFQTKGHRSNLKGIPDGHFARAVDVPSLPLVAALQQRRSSAVIAALLEAYPEAASTPVGEEGKLPLVVALLAGAEAATVEALLQVYPDAAAEPVPGGDDIPLKLAAALYSPSEEATLLICPHVYAR